MSIIDIKNVTFGYDGCEQNVFENLTATLDTDWKTGLVGRNGRGKTTFFKLLCGELPYRGSISVRANFIRYPFPLPDFSLNSADFLLALQPDIELWKLMRELDLLQCDAKILSRPFHTLSGGQRAKAMLAALFSGEDDSFALIDEPTNHLDVHGRRILAKYLRSKRGFMLAGHDRTLLDGCIDHVMSINRSGVEICKGNFTSFYDNLQRREESERARNEQLRKEISRLKIAAERTSLWADKKEKSKHGQRVAGLRPDRGHLGARAAAVMKLSKNAQTRQLKAAEEKQTLLKDVDTCPAVKTEMLQYRALRLINLKDVFAEIDGKRIFGGVNLSVCRGDAVALTGANGCGKTTLLKLLIKGGCPSAPNTIGEQSPTERQAQLTFGGEISIGSGIVTACVSQDVSPLRGSLQDYALSNGVDLSLFMTLLNKLGLYNLNADSSLENFSEGQKKKAAIAASLSKRAHLLIWDEPLNYIDLISRIQIEQLIEECRPTIVFVEHDEAFVNNVKTKELNMDGLALKR